MPMHRSIVHALTTNPCQWRPPLTRTALTDTEAALVAQSPEGGR